MSQRNLAFNPIHSWRNSGPIIKELTHTKPNLFRTILNSFKFSEIISEQAILTSQLRLCVHCVLGACVNQNVCASGKDHHFSFFFLKKAEIGFHARLICASKHSTTFSFIELKNWLRNFMYLQRIPYFFDVMFLKIYTFVVVKTVAKFIFPYSSSAILAPLSYQT